MRRRRAASALATLGLSLLIVGCGLGAGRAPGGVGLTVTRDFGTQAVRRSASPKVVGDETVMQLLMRNARVGTAYGGGFVQTVDGRSSAHDSGRPIDWFYYVNGIQATHGAAQTRLHPGDQVWWDLHDWTATESVPAVVGSFPEPFVHGDSGRRLPVRIDCADVSSPACRTVDARLRALGVHPGIAALGSEEQDTLTVVVGPWRAVRSQPGAAAIEQGPRSSGVYARPAPSGAALVLLDQKGRPGRNLAAGAGLIAATRYFNDEPSWFVTGTDDAGVNAAAEAFDSASLRDRFALATSGGQHIPLPLGSG